MSEHSDVCRTSYVSLSEADACLAEALEKLESIPDAEKERAIEQARRYLGLGE